MSHKPTDVKENPAGVSASELLYLQGKAGFCPMAPQEERLLRSKPVDSLLAQRNQQEQKARDIDWPFFAPIEVSEQVIESKLKADAESL